MRPTTLIGLAAMAIGGIMLADIWHNAQGTQAAANGIVNILKPTYNALLGQPS